MGYWDHDLSELPRYVERVSQGVGTPVPRNYPVFGEDAFRTATGVHAAAIAKALRTGDDYLADVIYSGVPAGMFGLSQQIEIGRMSGKSNVLFWLASKKLPDHPDLVSSILTEAHESRSVLTEEQLHGIVEDWKSTAQA